MKTIIRAFSISIVLLLICGIAYPMAMTGISQMLFHKQANGSIVVYKGKAVGSELLGQKFDDPRYFHGRISAVDYNTYKIEDKMSDENGKTSYNGPASGSSNLAPSNPKLEERVKRDIDEFLKANPDVRREDIPADLFTASGSGLDPHISPEAAKIQIPVVSKASGISRGELEKLVERCTEGRVLGVFGEPRVNVLKINMEIAKRLE